jgi:DMSO/TMAO reductase YedYZ molybdopterin-dependent catalytic subunit
VSDTASSRRRFFRRALAAVGTLALAGCQRLSTSDWFPQVLSLGEKANETALRFLGGRRAMAQEFGEADLSPSFRSNGTAMPATAAYQALLASGFADYRLEVGGLVGRPLSLSLAEVKALPSRTQITRHDCVEGWSAIGKWKGAKLAAVLDAAKPGPAARFVVFRCADPMSGDGRDFYYESIDLDDAYHAQTILAYEMNGAPLPVANGAPLRLRVERQLGYKHAKYVLRIELVESFAGIEGGRGGYWEDRGYQWFAGI